MNATDETIPSPPPPSPPPGGGEPPRRLTRSNDDKVLTGLCGGLGRYFGVDPVVFRIAFVVLSFVGGTGILVYLAGWLLIPDDTGVSEADKLLKQKHRKVALWVMALIGVGLLFDGFDRHGGNFPVALVLVGVGLAVLWSRRNGQPGGSAGGPGGGPTAPSPAAETSQRVSLAKDTGAAPTAPPPKAAPAGKAPRPRSVLVPATLSLLAILAGVMALIGVSPATGFAVALLVTGAALVIGAWRGRARGLIPIAMLLAVGLAAASVVDVPLQGGAGDRSYRPATVADIRSPYRLAVGHLTLDMAGVDLSGLPTTVVATVGVGQLTVIVPRAAEVVVVAHTGLGAIDVAGQSWEGADVDRRVVLPGQEGGGRLVLRARVGIGQVEVQRAFA